MPDLSSAALSAVTAWFKDNLRTRGDIGASVSVWQHGAEVLTLADGFCDRERSRPWTAETLVPVWSATKGPAAVCALHALHEKGVSLEERVTDMWPSFASGGKEAVRLRQLFSHTAGLCALDDAATITNYEAVIKALERQVPLWEPGTQQGYHARTFGFLLDEIVRRVAGAKSIGHYFDEQFRDRLGLHFWMGLPSEEWERVATVYPGRMKVTENNQEFLKAFGTAGSLTQRTFASPQGLNAVSDFNKPETWAQGFASMGGVGSASGLAKFYAMLAQGGKWDGQKIVAESVVRQLQQPLSQDQDLVLGVPVAFGAGMMKDPVDQDPRTDGGKLRQHYGPSLTAFGHPGAGGSLAFADPENEIGFAYVMNQMEVGALPGEKAVGLVEALYS